MDQRDTETSVDGPARRPTIRDVAREAGLSRGTVTRVLNNQQYVSPKARQAVEDACHRLGYVPSSVARNLANRRSQAVGFVIFEPYSLMLADPNIGSILLGANTVLSEADLQLVNLVIDSDRDRERVRRYLSGRYADGVIAVSARQHENMLVDLQDQGVPTVVVGRSPEGLDLPSVHIDNRGAAHRITRRLVDTGRRRVGVLAAALDRDSGADRLAGFREALGARFDPDLVEEATLYEYSAGATAMRRLLDRAPDVDGVFAMSDAMAAGALNALRQAGRSVPGDVGVVGFDDSEWARRCDPALSTVHQPAGRLGQEAARLLLGLLEGGGGAGRRGLLLPTEVVWRESA